MPPHYEIHGHCDPHFAAGSEVGGSFAAIVEGEFVVDLWAGHANAARTRPWERDTIVNVFSSTKAMTAFGHLRPRWLGRLARRRCRRRCGSAGAT